MIPVVIYNRKITSEIKKGSFIQYLENCHDTKTIIYKDNSLDFFSQFKDAVTWCKNHNHDYFLACSINADFPCCLDFYNLDTIIELGTIQHADVLVCSAMVINSPIPTNNPNLYWVDKVCSVDCMIIYKNSFKQILGLPDNVPPKHEITGLFLDNFFRKQLFSPYMKNKEGNNRFDCSKYIKSVQQQQQLYKKMYHPTNSSVEGLCLPVYIINLQERPERLEHILAEFKGRSEFDINVVQACKDECGALGLWKSIRKVISKAIQKDEDVIIICEDDHKFTPDYSKEFLFQQIIEGYSLGADYLNGGCADFKDAYVITKHLFGMITIRCTQFIIIYKDFFSTIMQADYDQNVLSDIKLSELTERKMVLYPFVSVQKDFGYSDVTQSFNQHDGYITTLFDLAQKRLDKIKNLSEIESFS